MIFSPLKSASALALLSTLVSAAPTSTPTYPPKSTAQNFHLVANITSNDLSPSINNYVLTSYHVGADEAYAVLVANTTVALGRIFYMNSTASEVQYGESNTLSDEGTPLFPAGLSINADRGSVLIDAGAGQPWIGLTRFPDLITELSYPDIEGFVACERAIESGSAIQAFAQDGNGILEGCVRLTLLPQCEAVGSGLEHPFGNTVNCYEDVAAIDWSVYSSD